MTKFKSEKTADRSSPDRTDIIIKNYNNMTLKELAEKLNETPRWVNRQIRNLIKQGKMTPKRGSGVTAARTTPDRIDFIIANHDKMSRKEIAEELGETERWIKRQIQNLIKDNKISPKRKKENLSVCKEDWSKEIIDRVVYLKYEKLKSYKEISIILKKEFNFSVTGVVVGMWLRKFGHTSINKIDWLSRHITKDIAKGFLDKGMTMVDISKYINKKFSLYFSDDLILVHFQSLGLMSQKQRMDFVPNQIGKQLTKKWLEDRINNHASIQEMCKEAGVSKTIINKRIEEENLSLIPHRKIWSNNLELLREKLLEVPAIQFPDKLFHECMLGWLFGDGHIDKYGRFVTNHSLKQLDYLYLKIRILKPYLSNIITVARTNFSGEGTYIGGGEQIGISCPRLERYTQYLNEDGSKNFDKIIEEMTPLSIACLYMDDGSLSHKGPTLSIKKSLVYHFENKYFFENVINDRDLKIKEINPDYLIPGMARKVKDLEVGKFWKEYVPELFDPEIKEDYQLSFLNNYLCDKNPKLLNSAVEYYHGRGFPYFKISEDYIYKEYDKLKKLNTKYMWKDDELIKYLDVGNHIFKNYMLHMVEAKFRQVSPLEVFKNYMQFRSVLAYTLKTKKPILPDFVYDNLIYFNGGVVGFPCSVAKTIAHEYCPENGIVVDPCAGWGGRLLGIVSDNRQYIGFEPWKKTFKGLSKIQKILKIDNAKVTNSEFSSEKAPTQCDLIFTSPPYIDLEIYGRSFTKKDWFSLMKEIFRYAEKALKKDSYLILNLPIFLKLELPPTKLKELCPVYFYTSARKKKLDDAEVLNIWQK